MADFDASRNPGISTINYTSTSGYFIAKWSNVRLRHCSEREFSFSVCLFENGTIVFAYDKIPHLHLLNGRLQGCPSANATPSIDLSREKRRSSQRDVIVGVSDAYLYEVKHEDRRRIAEYTTMNIPMQLIRSGTTITLTPLPTCVEQTTCADCLGERVQGFRCQWCPQIHFCSSGVDRDWQRWHENGCHLNSLRGECGPIMRREILIAVILVQFLLMLGLLIVLVTWIHGKSFQRRRHEWTNQALADVQEGDETTPPPLTCCP